MLQNLLIEEILNSRKTLIPKNGIKIFNREQAAEGGCGVIGIACSEQIAGRHLLQSLIQMRNRGNGKGGGIAAVGLIAEEFGVDQQILDEDYLLTIAYLDPKIRSEVESKFVIPTFIVDHVREQPQIQNHLSIDGLEVQPPVVVNYFVRVKSDLVDKFRAGNNLQEASQRYNIPSFLIRAVMAVESNFRPDAISSAGAKGLMQLMPETAEEMGVSNIFDPRQNILGGTRYLRVLANTFNGDLVLTLAAYNAGHLAVVRHMDIPPFAETQRYVRRVLKLYYFYKKQIQQSSEGTSKQGKSQ